MTSAKRIILNTFGSFGDVHPYIAIALELRERGHHPVIATSELYREKMLASDFEFVPVSPHLPPPQEQDTEMMERVMHPNPAATFCCTKCSFLTCAKVMQIFYWRWQEPTCW